MKTRDELRSRALATRPPKSEIIKDEDGTEYEVRQPSIRQRSDIRKAATTTNEDGSLNFEPFDFMLRAAMACTYIPETNELLFEDSDYEALISQPTGGLIDALSQAASRLCNTEGKIDEEKKP